MIELAAIVAMSANRVIGRGNQLPWHLPADLLHFKTLTTSHAILMGRKTYESIGRPLPNRLNLVLTKTHTIDPLCVAVHSLEEALQVTTAHNLKKLFIIGGAHVFNQYLSQVTTLYLTEIHHEFEGDAYFPALDASAWQEVSRKDYAPDDKNSYAYSFVQLKQICTRRP